MRYDRPKILLVDLSSEVTARLTEEGYNVTAGTFGKPYKVEVSDSHEPVVGEAKLPNYTEREIIIIDLSLPEVLDKPEGKKVTSDGENDWWCKCNRGFVDPRPRYMGIVRDKFDRIYEHGGLFVIFAQPAQTQDLIYGRIVRDLYGKHLKFEEIIEANNWSFLSSISEDGITLQADVGEEFDIPKGEDHEIFQFLRKYTKDAEYTTTLHSTDWIREKRGEVWVPLLFNKFGECVGAVIINEETTGKVLILPQIHDKNSAILEMLQGVLPSLSPHLFPHVEGARWVERDEYELKSVLDLKDQKIKARESYEQQVQNLDARIAGKRENLGFLHALLAETGDELVRAVVQSLEYIGFEQVINVDEENPEQAAKQEDLQILDGSPALLLEVKGLSGMPTESDTTQIVKYIPRRGKEWGKTDIRGVTIVNHQRHVPALERDDKNVFTEQQMKDAEHHDVTLVTTWDLFRLIRGMMKWGWEPRAIKELFYRPGRVGLIPSHYELIGEVAKFWDEPGVVSIEVVDELSVGDRIGYVLPDRFLEEEAGSLEIDREKVEKALAGQRVGLKSVYAKGELRKGMLVYRVGSTTESGGTSVSSL